MSGHRTSVDGLGNVLCYLLNHRDDWNALIEDPSLIRAATEELLRLDGPVLGFVRTTAEPVQLSGVTIPAGDVVVLLYASANRDEEHVERPCEFDPRRPRPAEHVAFGRGKHYCLGAHLARMEIRVALEQLTQRLPGLSLAPGQQIQHDINFALRGPEHLVATWE
jgi:cytochrome P450